TWAWLAPGNSGLAVARHRVVLGVREQARSVAVGPGGAERGGHPAAADLDLEAVRAQSLDVPTRRCVLPPAWLGEVPDVPVPVRPRVPVAVDPVERCLPRDGHVGLPSAGHDADTPG